MNERAPSSEQLVDRFLEKIRIQGLRDAVNRRVHITFDPGILHKPVERDVIIYAARPIRLDQMPIGSAVDGCLLGFDLYSNAIKMVASLKVNGDFHLVVTEGMNRYHHVRVAINDVDLGWFDQPNMELLELLKWKPPAL